MSRIFRGEYLEKKSNELVIRLYRKTPWLGVKGKKNSVFSEHSVKRISNRMQQKLMEQNYWKEHRCLFFKKTKHILVEQRKKLEIGL